MERDVMKKRKKPGVWRQMPTIARLIGPYAGFAGIGTDKLFDKINLKLVVRAK